MSRQPSFSAEYLLRTPSLPPSTSLPRGMDGQLQGTVPSTACPQVVAVTPPADAWVQQVVGYGVPELAARDLANM